MPDHYRTAEKFMRIIEQFPDMRGTDVVIRFDDSGTCTIPYRRKPRTDQILSEEWDNERSCYAMPSVSV